jgi:uncharacterized membrane protein
MAVLAAVNSYTILKMFHVLFAVLWVGGAITINIFGTRAVRSNDGPRIATFAGEAAWAGTHIFFPTSVLVLVSGIFTVLEGPWGFTDTWVLLGLIGIGLTIVTGSTFLGPQSRRVGELFSERGPDDPEARRILARVVAVGRIDLLVLTLVVVDMVLKPGA